MNLHICDTETELLTAMADYFIAQANDVIEKEGIFNVVLSGGSSPKKLYELLTTREFRYKTDWSKIYFFFGDERDVPAHDELNNALMAQKALFDLLPIFPSRIFKINTSLSPDDAAKEYMRDITNHFNDKPIQFDLILLGLGDNAHTASLFPFTDVLTERTATVRAVYLKEDDIYRITMSAPLINQANEIAFLVFGANKATAVQQVIEGERNFELYPAQLIRPTNGKVHWFLDKAAAGKLEKT